MERSNLDNQKSLGTDASTASVATGEEVRMRETVAGQIKGACVLRYGEEQRKPCEGKQRTKSGGGVRSRQKKQATG